MLFWVLFIIISYYHFWERRKYAASTSQTLSLIMQTKGDANVCKFINHRDRLDNSDRILLVLLSNDKLLASVTSSSLLHFICIHWRLPTSLPRCDWLQNPSTTPCSSTGIIHFTRCSNHRQWNNKNFSTNNIYGRHLCITNK